MPETQTQYPPPPPDDLNRTLTSANPDHEGKLPHIGLVGDTYSSTVNGDDTKGRFCVVDMHIPPGGGPGPHRHAFEETFIVLSTQAKQSTFGQRPAPVSQHVRKPRPSDLHLLPGWTGEILPGSRRPRGDSHHSSAQTR
jgi:hypothetical protein